MFHCMLIFSSLYLISGPSWAVTHNQRHWKLCRSMFLLHRFLGLLHPVKTLHFSNSAPSFLYLTRPAPSLWSVILYVAAKPHFISFLMREWRVNGKVTGKFKLGSVRPMSCQGSMFTKQYWLSYGCVVDRWWFCASRVPGMMFAFFALTVIFV